MVSRESSTSTPHLVETDSHILQLNHDSLGKSNEAAQISIGNVKNIMIGSNSKMVITSGTGKSSRRAKEIPNKRPITTSKEPLTMDQKMAIKDKVGRQWRDFGRRLGFGDFELEQLEMENVNNYSEVIYQILTKWEQRSPDGVTQEALAAIFIKMKRGDLADILCGDS